VREYLNISNTLDGYGVSVFSVLEPFNTETKEGRMMRNNLLNFAEFERETIASRVQDAYVTRASETGFYQGGQVYYGYEPERRTVNGKMGSVLVPSNSAEVVRIAYRLYQNPDCSLRDIIDYCRENSIEMSRPLNKAGTKFSNMDRSHLSQILKSPLYVRADKEVYRYLVSEGLEVIDDVEMFDGVHGLFRHNVHAGKRYIKVGYHEGLIDSETWLAVQDKKSYNRRIPNNGKANNSWLVRLVKCGYCGYALHIGYGWNAAHTKQWRYFRDGGAYNANGCVKKFLRTRPDEVEEAVCAAMEERLNSLVIAKSEKKNPDIETERFKAELIRIDGEIRELMDKLAKADDVLFGYIQDKVRELHIRKSGLEEKVRNKQRKRKEIDTTPLTDPMNHWSELTVEEKRALAGLMIDVVNVTDENGIEIRFGI
jgi:hypothetical protein